ncbi:uncharacterized protein [Palaemon carinicauda]|uniref:uncharacterized protein n=1 Tax=Palaemon carinicauda TaxID=392227 RepID=UPI0035B600D9
MKRTLLLLALVAGIVLAKKEKEEEAKVEGRDQNLLNTVAAGGLPTIAVANPLDKLNLANLPNLGNLINIGDLGGAAAGLAGLKVLKTAALAALVGPLGALFEIGMQVVILVALILLISTLKKQLGDLTALFEGKYEEEDYGYYPSGGYDTGATGGSSYAATGGHSGGGHYSKRSASAGGHAGKRSVSTPSIMDLPLVQKLTARIHEAIENFNY